MQIDVSPANGRARTRMLLLAGLSLAAAGCYEGFEGDGDGEDDDDEVAPFEPESEPEPEPEPGPTSQQGNCDPQMRIFPVAAAHNIGWDQASCGSGTCEVSCPDAHANSDWSAAGGHHGIDVFAHPDAPLVAVADGTVVAVGTPSNTSGLRVRIRDACGWEYYYGHMSGAAVAKGDAVAAGQLIGTMGATGTHSVHLHFNVSWDGNYDDDINPIDLLRWTSATACGAEPPPQPQPPPEPQPPTEPQPPPEDSCGMMPPGTALFVEDALFSCNGEYAIVLQSDGNAVIYDVGGPAIWDTKTVGHASHALVMQDDGNFVIYDEAGAPVWNAGTYGHPGAVAFMQDDGNFVIYDGDWPIWSTR